MMENRGAAPCASLASLESNVKGEADSWSPLLQRTEENSKEPVTPEPAGPRVTAHAPCRASCPHPDHSPGKLHSAALHPELPLT